MNTIIKYLESKKSDDFAIFALRVFAGLAMAFGHGLSKLPPNEMLISAVKSMGLPSPILFSWLAALGEFGGGILLALGLLTRPAAFLILITMGVAAFGIHGADPYSNREPALLFFFISFFFVFCGPGKFSFDYKIFKRS